MRILDLSRLFAGNVCTQMLGDFGAEVIKVEPPEGDTLRAWKTEGVSTHWKIYARNKKSLCLDLRNPQASEIIKALVPSAHMFIESFRPGVLEKMGLGPETLLELNPKLVIMRISGWGQDGPYSQRPGFGTVVEGISGFAAINGFADREPVLPPMYLADGIAGIYGASAAMIALREVEMKGGQGQVIDLPLLDPLFSILGPSRPITASRARSSRGPEAARRTRLRAMPIDARTGGMSVSQPRSRRWPSGCSGPSAGLTSSTIPSSGRTPTGSRTPKELDAIIGAFIAERTQAENVAFFEAAEVTIGPIYDTPQILEDPHFIEREVIADYPDPDMGALPMHHVVPRLGGTPGSIRTPAPGLGEHNRSLLAEIGIDDAKYAELVTSGVVRGDSAQG